ncbi:TonB-dependent receptor [Porphyromonadaceae bacterium W3.11]|nr:TonB-dependent receptor [Porphyromonadaceae bacterium W3.11]
MNVFFHGWSGVRCIALLCFILLTPFSKLSAQEMGDGIKIQVVDTETSAPLPSVIVTAHDYRGTTDNRGFITLPDKLPIETNISFSLIGYETISIREADLSHHKVNVIKLRFGSTTLEEFSVEARRPIISRTMVGESIDLGKQMMELDSDLSEAISHIKGVSMISSTTSSTPVIHGMSGNRILIINNGVTQEAQQWNNDFGTDIDASNADQISVLKGAESVRYGSDALGGVILINGASLPYNNELSGSIQTQYRSNGRGIGASAMLEGSIRKNFAYRLQTKYSNVGDHSSAKYLLNNTGARGVDLLGNIGWKNKALKFELLYHLTHHESGILYVAKMGSVDLLEERIKIGQPIELFPFSRKIDYPKHRATHQYLVGKASWDTNSVGKWMLQVALQNDKQEEFHVRRMRRSHIPSVSLTLNNIQGQLKWENNYWDHWSSELGLQSEYTNNYNRAGTGVVPLIPNYVESKMGFYGIQKYHNNHLGMELGARIDQLQLTASGIDMYSRPYGGHRRYTNFTANFGLHYHLRDHLKLTTQVGNAWRAPHVGELWSEGVDATGGLYLRGDSTMRSERNYKWVTSILYHSDKLSISLEGYLQWINGYINKEPTGEFFTVISGSYPLFKYRQTSATLHGVDASIEWHPISGLTYTAMTGMMWGNERKTKRYLPYIPPFRFSQSLTYALPVSLETNIELSHKFTAQQKRFDPDTDLIPYAPPAYHLLGLKAATSIPIRGEQELRFMLSVTNLLNKEYKEYTNLSRYYAHALGRDITFSVKYIF